MTRRTVLRAAAPLALVMVLLGGALASAATVASDTELTFASNTVSAPTSLSGATVGGIVTVSVNSAGASVASIAYFLDNATGGRTPTVLSRQAPFALRIDTAKLRNGPHSLLAVVRKNGKTIDVFARFTVEGGTNSAESTAANKVQAKPAGNVPTKLRILLTNDDGFDAGGIVAVRKALLKAGHDVTVVAPDGNRSGSGAKKDGVTAVKEESAGVFSVAGMPSDATLAGLAKMQADGGLPDLVVSGTNLGQNSGRGVVQSGTVGAAVTAARRGLPVIASSTHQAESEADCEATANYLARVVSALSKGGLKLPRGEVLNINYPTKKASKVQFSPAMEVDLDGTSMTVRNEGVPENDRPSLDEGMATVAEIDADGKAGTPRSVKALVATVAP